MLLTAYRSVRIELPLGAKLGFHQLLFHFRAHDRHDLFLVFRKDLHGCRHLIITVCLHFSLQFFGNFFKQGRVFLYHGHDHCLLVFGNILQLRLEQLLHCKIFYFSKHRSTLYQSLLTYALFCCLVWTIQQKCVIVPRLSTFNII